VRLAVRDGGAGVAPSHLGRIFEPFYRGETELTRRSKGTGIGLALVRGLAERMGATVSGRNLPEGGFEVEIVFPAAVGVG
jgi:signal transduction histidine kinase